MLLQYKLSKKDLFLFSNHVRIKSFLFILLLSVIALCYMFRDTINAAFIEGIEINYFFDLWIYFIIFFLFYFIVIAGTTYLQYLFFPVKKYENMIGDIELEITEEKIIQRLNGNHEEVLQKNIIKVEEMKKYYLFFVTKISAYIIPKRCIENVEEFKNILLSYKRQS